MEARSLPIHQSCLLRSTNLIALRIWILLAGITLAVSAHGQKKVYFTSLEWPPYSGAELRGYGASVAVAKAAFEVMGYDLHVDFFPWARTVGLAKAESSHYHGYFPEYYSAEIEQEFLFSDPMGTGPLGFAEQSFKPVLWEGLDDLASYKIGVVRGYVNTEELDKRIVDGRIKAEPVVADVDNIKKLSVGRLDLAVIDPNVFQYLITHEPELKRAKGLVKINSKILENKELFLCFKKTEEGQELKAIFNQGLKKIDIEAIMSDFLRQ